MYKTFVSFWWAYHAVPLFHTRLRFRVIITPEKDLKGVLFVHTSLSYDSLSLALSQKVTFLCFYVLVLYSSQCFKFFYLRQGPGIHPKGHRDVFLGGCAKPERGRAIPHVSPHRPPICPQLLPPHRSDEKARTWTWGSWEAWRGWRVSLRIPSPALPLHVPQDVSSLVLSIRNA